MIATSSILDTLECNITRKGGTLILSLPSSLEREFSKVPYSKSMSSFLQKTKIDYCLMFVINKQKLNQLLHEVHPFMKNDAGLWIAIPKHTSKILTNLRLYEEWDFMTDLGYYKYKSAVLDSVWSALSFKKIPTDKIQKIKKLKEAVQISQYINEQSKSLQELHPFLEQAFAKETIAYEFFKTLSFQHQADYIRWIHSASDKEVVLHKRIEDAMMEMQKGVLDPFLNWL